MQIVLVIVLGALAIWLIILNLMEGYWVWLSGWLFDDRYIARNTENKFLKALAWIVTLPGALIGFLLGIALFRWIKWLKEWFDMRR